MPYNTPMITHRVKVSGGGRVVLPAKCREALGINIGDEVVIRVTNGEAVISGVVASIAHAQRIAMKYAKSGRSAVDELIKERRREAGHG